jgi:type II secretory pathway pseudopilin PulG
LAIPIPATWQPWLGDVRSLLVVILGLIVTITKGLDGLLQTRETWVRQSVTLNALANERMLFESRSGDYGTAVDPTSLFGQNIAAILKTDTQQWQKSYVAK